jgi:hypothetical protein
MFLRCEGDIDKKRASRAQVEPNHLMMIESATLDFSTLYWDVSGSDSDVAARYQDQSGASTPLLWRFRFGTLAFYFQQFRAHFPDKTAFLLPASVIGGLNYDSYDTPAAPFRYELSFFSRAPTTAIVSSVEETITVVGVGYVTCPRKEKFIFGVHGGLKMDNGDPVLCLLRHKVTTPALKSQISKHTAAQRNIKSVIDRVPERPTERCWMDLVKFLIPSSNLVDQAMWLAKTVSPAPNCSQSPSNPAVTTSLKHTAAETDASPVYPGSPLSASEPTKQQLEVGITISLNSKTLLARLQPPTPNRHALAPAPTCFSEPRSLPVVKVAQQCSTPSPTKRRKVGPGPPARYSHNITDFFKSIKAGTQTRTAVDDE